MTSGLGLHCLSLSQSKLYTALLHHSNKNSVAINYMYCYLDFILTRGLISLVSDNHVDINLKEILVYVLSCKQMTQKIARLFLK